MSYSSYRLKLKIGIVAGVGTLCLYGITQAQDISLIRFSDQSYELPLGRSSTQEDTNKSITFGISLKSRRPSDLGTLYSKSALEDYDFRFRGMNNSEKANAMDVLKAAMDEFEILHGVRDAFQDTESKLDQYIKKFKLKGEFDLSEEGENNGAEQSPNTSSKNREIHSFFHKVFVPDRIKWNLDMGHGGNSLGAELDLGDYLSIRGDVGENTGAFMMFKVDF
jgi:hypothetical protein